VAGGPNCLEVALVFQMERMHHYYVRCGVRSSAGIDAQCVWRRVGSIYQQDEQGWPRGEAGLSAVGPREPGEGRRAPRGGAVAANRATAGISHIRIASRSLLKLSRINSDLSVKQQRRACH
jgi:hypothetical protein